MAAIIASDNVFAADSTILDGLSANLTLGFLEGLLVIWAKLRWAVPEVSGHAQVKRDLKLDVDGPL